MAEQINNIRYVVGGHNILHRYPLAKEGHAGGGSNASRRAAMSTLVKEDNAVMLRCVIIHGLGFLLETSEGVYNHGTKDPPDYWHA